MRSVSYSFFVAASLMMNFGPCGEPTEKREQPREASQAAESQEILVKFKASVTEDSANTTASNLGLQKVRDLRAIGVRVYRVPPGKDAQELIKQLQANPNVEYAEPNLEYRIPEKQN